SVSRALLRLRLLCSCLLPSLLPPRPPRSPLFPYTTLFRSGWGVAAVLAVALLPAVPLLGEALAAGPGGLTPSLVGRSLLLADSRSEEHTSELQSHLNLVCRLLLEKKNDKH